MNEPDTGSNPPAGEQPAAGSAFVPDHSLRDDVRALIGDSKTYLEAELQFQKSRAALVTARGRSGAIYATGALLLLHLALITLAIGLVFALEPVIGPWGAVTVVVGLLLVVAVLLGLIAKRRFAGLSRAFRGETGA